jgi:hypothetical protein
MSYGVNSPFGLRPYGHQISGVDDIKVNSNYTISANSLSLNKGDPVMYVPQNAQYAVVANGYRGQQSEIMLYNPIVTLQAGGTATTVIPQNGVAGQPIVGVFQGCEYYTPNGTYVAQEYWQAGTATNGRPVIASIIDDPFVIYDIQLGTYTGATFGALTTFMLLPCLQIQDGTWPDTGGANNNPVIGGSCVIGSNLTLMTGNNVAAAVAAGNSATMTGITLNGVNAGYQDNPLIANQGLVNGNPWGISTFYACPSLAVSSANPSVTNGANEYVRTTALSGDLRVLGFTPDPRNVPGTFGQPGNGTAGNYFNTPFLNVLVTINKHANKQGNSGVTIA